MFVSSHLLAEMANTADRLVVIGKGRLIASTTMSEFVGQSGADTVRVRSPQLDRLRGRWPRRPDVPRTRTGPRCSFAAHHRGGRRDRRRATSITLHELSRQRASLEEAYMKLTDEAVEYRGEPVSGSSCINAERIKLTTTRSHGGRAAVAPC